MPIHFARVPGKVVLQISEELLHYYCSYRLELCGFDSFLAVEGCIVLLNPLFCGFRESVNSLLTATGQFNLNRA